MNPKILRLGLYMVGSMLLTLGAADSVIGEAGIDPPNAIPDSLAKLLMVAGSWIVGYAKTARKLGDLNVFELAPDVIESMRPTVPTQPPAATPSSDV